MANSGASRKASASLGRVYAWSLLDYIRKTSCFLSVAFNQVEKPAGISAEDEAFARLLASGCISCKGSLDTLINKTLSKPSDIKPKVRLALYIAFYELFYLKKPTYAVCDQGVELIRVISPKATGVANYSLRRAVEMLEDGSWSNSEAPRASSKEVSPLSVGYPEWLYSRLNIDFGETKAQEFTQASNLPAPLFFTFNTALISHEDGCQQLHNRGISYFEVEPELKLPAALPLYVFEWRNAIADELVTSFITEGKIIVSDASAQLIAQLAVPECMPDRFLEIGAGRGTKSALIQNTALRRFGTQMALDTLDVNVSRSDERLQRLSKSGIKESIQYVQDGTHLLNLKKESYDAVFVDAPCSGVGTMRRHPDIRWRLKVEDVSTLAQTGFAILKASAPLVASEGFLTYATCTVLAEENEQVIDAFLATNKGKRFEKVLQLTTGMHKLKTVTGVRREVQPDSHYVCVLRAKHPLIS